MRAAMNPPRHPVDARLSLRRKFLVAALAATLALMAIGAATVVFPVPDAPEMITPRRAET